MTTTATNPVQQAFNQAGNQYDAYSSVQQEAGHQLIRALQQPSACNTPLLDLGCGSGMVTYKLYQHCPEQPVTGIDFCPAMLAVAAQYTTNTAITFHKADFDTWLAGQPPACYQLIFSNMALQWSTALHPLLEHCYRCLQPGGELAFSIPLDGTFTEIQPLCHVNPLPDPRTITALLEQAGFTRYQHDHTTHRPVFRSLRESLHAIKATGACAQTGSTTAPLNRRVRALRQHLRAQQSDCFPLTYQIGYFHAWR